jgi:DNA-binding protein HU-beta
MNRTELITVVAEKTGFARKDVEKTIKVMIDEVIDTVAKKEKVQLTGFGTFEAREHAARIGKNPHTGEELKIAAVTVPAFKAGKGFKKAVAEKKSN